MMLDGTGLERWHFSYDFRNQLVQTQHGFGAAASDLMVVTHTYDAAARRVLESEDVNNDGTIDAARQFVYGGASLWEVIEQIDLAGGTETLLTTHVFGSWGVGIDDEIGYRQKNQSPADNFWSHRDDLNSLTSITDDSGAVVERYEHGDYGQVRILDETGVDVGSSSFYGAFHLYTGRPMLAGTGLYDYRFRVMDSATGRFVQRDPLGNIDTLNIYIYANISPLTWNDPIGLVLDWLPIASTIKHAMESTYVPGNQPGHYFGCGGIASKSKCNDCATQTDKDALQAQCEKCIDGQALKNMIGYAGGGIAPDMAWGAIGAAIGAKATGKAAANGGVLLLDSIIDAGIQIDVLTDIYNAAKAAKGSVCHCQ